MLLSNEKVHIFSDFSFTHGYMCVYVRIWTLHSCKRNFSGGSSVFYSTKQNHDFLENYFSLDNYWESKSQVCINERLRGNKMGTLSRHFTKVYC